jgi:protocatechuate 3,4-dioxygenase beta subunit
MMRISRRPRPSSGYLTIILLAALFVPAVAAPTQTPQQIKGRVVADADGAPIAHARVLVGLRVVGETSDTGQFDVSVPAGKALVHVEKAGFLPQAIDRNLSHDVKLVRGAVLIVRVVDEGGNPVGLRRIRVAGPGGYVRRITDDRGVDRMSGLAAGKYVADLDVFAAPAGEDADDRAEQTRRDMDARQALLDRRNSGVQLKAGDEVTITVMDPWRPGPKPRSDTRTGTISGRVTDPAGVPVPGARVRLVAALGQQGTLTDSMGAFAFEGVAPGKYAIYGQANGFMPAAYGQAPGTEPTIVAIAAGQRRNDVNVQLYRGGSVSGTVRDEHGGPHDLFSVQLLAVKPDTRELVGTRATGVDVTDEQGRYRVSGLISGTYVLVARPRAGRTEGPVYYPDALRFEDAKVLTVTEGTETTGLDLTTDARRGASLVGVVTDGRGTIIQGGSVRLHGTTRATAALPDRIADIDADGRFEFLSVPPGGYALTTGSTRGFDAVTISGVFESSISFRFPPRESGGTDVVVPGSGAMAADIQTSLKAMVTGRLVLEDQSAAISPSSVELSAARGDAKAMVRDDWTFQLRDISEVTRLTLTAAPPGWWLKSIVVKNVNAADVPVEFGLAEHSRHGVVAVLSHTAARLSGRILDAGGRGVANATVFVFSVDRSRWDDRSLHRQRVKADADGHYSASVPPGEYWVAAAPETVELATKTLDALTKSAVRIAAAPSAEVNQDVRADVRRP